MRRREFITLVGGATAWPPMARAQQAGRIRRIASDQKSAHRVAVLFPTRDGDLEYQHRLDALMHALQQLGWTGSRNLQVNVRWTGGSSDKIQVIASELVALSPDVILGSGSVATAALKRATTSIPVVFVMVNEPVAQGFVASLARPGSNITGFTNTDFSVMGKWVELLKSMDPAVSRIGLMYNSDSYPIYDSYVAQLQGNPQRPADVVRAAVRSGSDIEPVVDALAARPGSGLVVLPDGGFTITNRATIQAAVDRHHLPSIGPYRQFVLDGALMSYGPDDIDIFRRAADYVDRLLKGAKPADLPVQQPEKFQLVINQKTAMALNLQIPPTLLAIADEVIE
jgi:putative tryptophan/tyrosine transport system substrate-binding protein